jgi:flavin reductase (DIM6/NTAB) family NADH-FMN oxidoreductase RutF
MSKIDLDLSRATRLLQPGPVALVTTKYKGKANVFVAAWVTPVSANPPQVALAVFPAIYSHALIQKSGAFTLNIPPRPLAEKVKKVGDVSGEVTDKFLSIGLTPYEGRQLSAPLIAECIGHLECGVTDTQHVGDHTVYFAEIVAASADDLAFDGESWTLADESVKPLHHLGANRYAVLEARIAV